MARRMAGAREPLRLSRRSVVLGLAIVPLATCTLPRPDKDVPFIPAEKAGALSPEDPNRLVELVKLDPTIRLDMRYATANNFTGRVLYDEARAFLAVAAAKAVVRANAAARAEGFGLTIYDAYRPWRVTRQLWDATPVGPKKNYVANPKRGSKHNRGCAVDLTLHDLKTGALVEMPTEFDDFSEKAHRDYAGASPIAIANRARLQRYLEAEGFFGLSNEWWHFDFTGWEKYPVMDVPFDKIA
jgi:zinc D-Ala-D-Ala dipeptidase